MNRGKKAMVGLMVAGALTAIGSGMAMAQQGGEADNPERIAGADRLYPSPEGTPVYNSAESPVVKDFDGEPAVTRSGDASGGSALPAPEGDYVVAAQEQQFASERPVAIDLVTVAKLLGTTTQELDGRLRDGESLAEIAGPEKTPELIEAIVASQLEIAGTEDREDTDSLKNLVTDLVNSDPPGAPSADV